MRGAAAEAAAGRPSTEEQLPLIGGSPAMQDIYRSLARLMGTDLTVTIYGESGTGKELVARALHDYGKRRHGRIRLPGTRESPGQGMVAKIDDLGQIASAADPAGTDFMANRSVHHLPIILR